MRKNNLPIVTLIGLDATVLIISFFSFQYIYKVAREELIQSQMQAGQREIREIGKLLEAQLKSNISSEQVIENLQSSIANTDTQAEFICMYNTKGIELCHPDASLIGQVINDGNSLVKSNQDQQVNSFLKWLQKGKGQSGIRSFPGNNRPSEIVSIYPVEQTDWLVALHVNVQLMTSKLSVLYIRLLVVFLISALSLIAISYAFVRFIYRKYERTVDSDKNNLNQEIEGLQVLNRHLKTSQEKLRQELLAPSINNEDNIASKPKKRIITYNRDELVKLDTEDIAFAVLKNGITCLHTFTSSVYTTNDSLDEVMKNLGTTNFYRANRQLIVNIRAIKTIQLFGNNQLKLMTVPDSKTEVLISKNKVANFKEWLDQ